jgi:hypothetical protein
MMWGLIGLFVMFSVWGIVKFAQGVFGIQGDNVITVPNLRFGLQGAQTTSGGLFSTGDGASTGITAAGIANQAQAEQLYNYCIQNGGLTGACQTAANNALANSNNLFSTGGNAATGISSAGGVANKAQADQLYNYCVRNGGADAACRNAANNALQSNFTNGTPSLPSRNSGTVTASANPTDYSSCMSIPGNTEQECTAIYGNSNYGNSNPGTVTASANPTDYSSCMSIPGNTEEECAAIYGNSNYGNSNPGTVTASANPTDYSSCMSISGNTEQECTAIYSSPNQTGGSSGVQTAADGTLLYNCGSDYCSG